jgi:hypothetical protein
MSELIPSIQLSLWCLIQLNFNLHFVLATTAWMQFLALGIRVRGVSG